MTFLPIVTRELRVASRQAATYWMRLSNAAITLVLLTMMWVSMTSISPRTLGLEIFQMMAGMNFLYCLGAGMQLTADSISREKREGTLGFLFLTDLKGYDVVLGKVAVTSLRSCYGLLAMLPVMAVPILMGGVTLVDVFRVMVVMVDTMLFSLSAGILVSVFSHDARKAAGLAFALVMGITAGLPVLGWLLAMKLGLNANTDLWLIYVLSPVCSMFLAFDRVGLNPGRFWGSCAVVWCWSALFLLLASRFVGRSWQDKPASRLRMRWRERLRDWLQGRGSIRAAFRSRLLNINPMLWLTSRNRLRPCYPWIFILAGGVIWVWGFARLQRYWLGPGTAAAYCIILHLLLKLGLATQAGERLSEEMRSGSLELILSTRISVEELLRGQLLSLRRHFGAPVAFVLLADLVMVLAALWVNPEEMDLSESFEFAIAAGGAMMLLVMDLVALSWVGMWMGLSSRDHKRASSETIGRILVLPWLGVGVISASVSLVQWRFGWNVGMPFLVGVGLWFGFSVATNLYFMRWARQNLGTQFRLMAMRRYLPETPHRFWTLLGRQFGRLLRLVTRAKS